MGNTDDLEHLISRVTLGDRAAFGRLYERTSAKLFGVCLRILRDKGDAEEVLQDVYVKIWHKAELFSSGRASVIAWLVTIARNQAVDRFRARKPVHADMDAVTEFADDAPSPEACAIRTDEARRVQGCLGELKEEHAAAIRRTYLNGWTYLDAAKELDVPLNTVRTWIRRGLLALRECLNR